jgi:nitroreductase
MVKDLVIKNRSCRRFYQYQKIDDGILKELINLARLSPSARNLQPLKYIISNTPEKNSLIFPRLHWAGYLKEGGIDIEDGERPSAYIIILGDRKISVSYGCDYGIASQSILLGAVEQGLGGCIIGSIDYEDLRNALNIKVQYDILLIIAIGKPKEEIILEEMRSNGDVKYWRNNDKTHHVPKRSLNDIILDN